MNSVHKELIALWEKHFSDNDAKVLMPLICPPLEGDRLLFVGLNPSWPTRLQAHESISNFYSWLNRSKFDYEQAMQFERDVRNPRKPYAYFKPFIAIADYVGVEWEDIDLYFYREKSQDAFNARITSDWHEFGIAQVELSTRLIKEAEPRIIVIANALASRIFCEKFNPQFSEEYGCHITTLTSNPVPTFLGSMLSGQRAMDVYSRERLMWHIKKVYNEFYHGPK